MCSAARTLTMLSETLLIGPRKYPLKARNLVGKFIGYIIALETNTITGKTRRKTHLVNLLRDL